MKLLKLIYFTHSNLLKNEFLIIKIPHLIVESLLYDDVDPSYFCLSLPSPNVLSGWTDNKNYPYTACNKGIRVFQLLKGHGNSTVYVTISSANC
jgi:hypothetical protein